MLGELTVSDVWCILSPSHSQLLSFLGVPQEPSQVCCVSPLGSSSQAMTLLADVNHPGSQEDLVSNWEPAHNLVEDMSLGPRLPLAFQLWLLPPASLLLTRGWAGSAAG